MILQVQDLLHEALGLIGAIAIDETPTASEYNQALRTLNVMVDRWSTQRLLLRSSTPQTFTMTAGKYIYTIGASGADILAPKPLKILSAFYTDMAGIDNAVEVIDRTAYNNLSDKHTSTGPTMYICYDSGGPQQTTSIGTLFVYMSPDQPYALSFESDCYLTEFVNLADTVSFEPAYYEALIYNLAVRLFRYYRAPADAVPQDILQIATNAINDLKNLNSVTILAGMELPGKVSSYNIYSDRD